MHYLEQPVLMFYSINMYGNHNEYLIVKIKYIPLVLHK